MRHERHDSADCEFCQARFKLHEHGAQNERGMPQLQRRCGAGISGGGSFARPSRTRTTWDGQ